jgi:hypothetical protein
VVRNYACPRKFIAKHGDNYILSDDLMLLESLEMRPSYVRLLIDEIPRSNVLQPDYSWTCVRIVVGLQI